MTRKSGLLGVALLSLLAGIAFHWYWAFVITMVTIWLASWIRPSA
ncbi:MAG: hypothetical protein WCL38_05230 [Actinomycetota bacterium]